MKHATHDYWTWHKEALLPLTIENVEAILAYPGKTWWTVGELAESCRDRRSRGEHPQGGSAWFDILPLRIQYQLVKRALTVLRPKLDRALGSDDGREVRVFALRNRTNHI